MIVHDETRFPHPVLFAGTGDYQSGEFDISLDLRELQESTSLSLTYQVTLTEQQIRRHVESGSAAVGFYAVCEDTFFMDLCELSLSGGQFDFDHGVLSGTVSLRPLIWAKQRISGFDLSHCHGEFGGGVQDFEPGDVLGFAFERRFQAGREKLARIESIFTLARSEELASGSFGLDLENERITILVAADIYDTVNNLRGLGHGRAILFNAIYMPAVMSVLSSLSEPGVYEEKRWFRVFTGKCEMLSIDWRDPQDLWSDAQRLLETPFSLIHENRDLIGG